MGLVETPGELDEEAERRSSDPDVVRRLKSGRSNSTWVPGEAYRWRRARTLTRTLELELSPRRRRGSLQVNLR